MCIISKIWSFHGVINAESCLLFALVVSFFLTLSTSRNSQELSRMRKSFYISILLLCAYWNYTWHGRAKFHISYGLFPSLQKGLGTPTVTSRNLPGLPWVLGNPSCGGTWLGKAKAGKEQGRIKLELVNSWIPLPREVPCHCSNFPGSTIALSKHRGFTPGNVHVMNAAIAPYKVLSWYLMTGRTFFESFFGNLNTQGYSRLFFPPGCRIALLVIFWWDNTLFFLNPDDFVLYYGVSQLSF